MKFIREGDNLRLKLSQLERLFAFHGDLSIPVGKIVNISTNMPDHNWWDLRMPGTFLPRVIKAGTYYSRRGKEFWYATFNKKEWIVV